MQETFGATLPFFALILCGYVARWLGVMGDGSAKVINNFVLYFALPALLVRTLAGLPISTLLAPDFLIAWTAVGAALFALVVISARRAMRQTGPDAVVQAATASLGNVGYLGITVVVSLLGEKALAAVSMAVIVDLVVIIPTTIALLEFLGTRSQSLLNTLRSVARSFVVNPFVVAIFSGLFLSFANISFPQGVDDFLRILSMAAVPTALFAIGVTLFGQSIRVAWIEITLLCALKLIIHPIAMFIVTAVILDMQRDLVAAATLLAALPIANNAFVIAMRFDVRPEVISGAILASTSAALVTFNIWASMFAS